METNMRTERTTFKGTAARAVGAACIAAPASRSVPQEGQKTKVNEYGI